VPTLASRLVRDFHKGERLPDDFSPVAAGAVSHFLQVGVELFGDLKVQANLFSHCIFSLSNLRRTSCAIQAQKGAEMARFLAVNREPCRKNYL
jgi:hypothetical protein